MSEEALPLCVYRLLTLLDGTAPVCWNDIPAELQRDAWRIAYNRGLIQTDTRGWGPDAVRHEDYRRALNMPFWLTEAGKDALALHRAAENERGAGPEAAPAEPAPAVPSDVPPPGLAAIAVSPPTVTGAPGHENGPMGIILDLREWKATRGSKDVSFAGKAYPWNVFRQLCRSYPSSLSPNDLVDAVWGKGEGSKETLQAHMTTVREIIKPLGLLVNNTRNVGYKLADCPEEPAAG
jgi:hypothetical protein